MSDLSTNYEEQKFENITTTAWWMSSFHPNFGHVILIVVGSQCEEAGYALTMWIYIDLDKHHYMMPLTFHPEMLGAGPWSPIIWTNIKAQRQSCLQDESLMNNSFDIWTWNSIGLVTSMIWTKLGIITVLPTRWNSKNTSFKPLLLPEFDIQKVPFDLHFWPWHSIGLLTSPWL